ncbi:MAG: hypothetical protein ACI396_05650 [Acutalibacteraceae bacterium]
MRKSIICVIAVIVSIAMVLSLSGCGGPEKDIKNLLTEFENACNTLDFDAVLDCIDPKVSDKVKLAVGVVGMFTDSDTDELFDSLADYLSKDDIGGKDFFSSIKIKVEKISVEDDAATVSTTLTYSVNGEETVREASFYCIYYTEKWYISYFTID